MAVIGKAVSEGQGDESILMDVLEAVATTADTPVDELPPLQETLDVQALVDLYTRSTSTPDSLTFTYYGYRVTIEQDTIVVRADPS
jgi:hypothetical protein